MNYFRLEQRIEEHMHQAHVPALTLTVVNEREILYARGFGLTSIEEGGAPVSPRTLFRIGSVTKPLVGTAVMRLVEDGQLDLDRPLKAYIDWLRFSMPHAEECITLRMLLSHTAGLPADSWSGASDADGLERYVREQIPRYSFIAPPGRLYSYANAGFSLAGYVGQVVTGKRFADLMQQLVFDPLEMKHTTFDPRVVLTYPFALPHILRNEQLRVLHRISDGQAIAPAGGAYSTVLDVNHKTQ
jgi:CubicO group peptidase (beta-lactamase class C family)